MSFLDPRSASGFSKERAKYYRGRPVASEDQPPSAERHSSFAVDLGSAHVGSQQALGRLLESCRAYLLMVADRELSPELRGKVSASDIVQETFLEAKNGFPQFRGRTEDELRAWLRRILLNNVHNSHRTYRGTDRRDVVREVPGALSSSSEKSANRIVAPSSSPSEQAMRRERDDALERAMASLSSDHQQVIRLRHEEGWSFAKIGRLMNRSEDAARKLWARAIEALREQLEGRFDVG